jgi:hypothetical protein
VFANADLDPVCNCNALSFLANVQIHAEIKAIGIAFTHDPLRAKHFKSREAAADYLDQSVPDDPGAKPLAHLNCIVYEVVIPMQCIGTA